MVTPIQPGTFPYHTQHAENQSGKINRPLSEAKRLLFEHRITGAKAMRIQGLIESAEQTAGSGKVIEAERIAREALNITRQTIDETGITSTETSAKIPKDEDEQDKTAIGTEESDTTDKNLIAERETTTYSDGSDDEGISFQYAQPLTQAQAPFAVRQHELSHVRRDTSEAILNGQKVLTSVRIFSRIDPMTGERHVHGGNTRIVVFPNIEAPSKMTPEAEIGNNIDTKV